LSPWQTGCGWSSAGVTIADTTRGYRILETHHAPSYYIPPEDVLMAALVPTSRETFCEWKGRAAYFDIVLDGRRSRNAAWAYPAPVARYAALKDHLSFYASSVDAAYVGDHPRHAAAGRFLRWLGDAEPDRADQGRGGHAALVGVSAGRRSSAVRR
jgi:uncharacterized protein (DUF427 family)